MEPHSAAGAGTRAVMAPCAPRGPMRGHSPSRDPDTASDLCSPNGIRTRVSILRAVVDLSRSPAVSMSCEINADQKGIAASRALDGTARRQTPADRAPQAPYEDDDGGIEGRAELATSRGDNQTARAEQRHSWRRPPSLGSAHTGSPQAVQMNSSSKLHEIADEVSKVVCTEGGIVGPVVCPQGDEVAGSLHPTEYCEVIQRRFPLS
jgi:hypothetical protein